MLLNVIPFKKIWPYFNSSLVQTTIGEFISFLERRLGGQMVYDVSGLPFAKEELLPLIKVATELKRVGVIKNFYPSIVYPDEPLQWHWTATCNTEHNNLAGGMSALGDTDALISTLAEALERYLWFKEIDALKPIISASIDKLQQKQKKFVDPNDFVGINDKIRSGSPLLQIRSDSEFKWTLGHSWSDDTAILIPVQTITGNHELKSKDEPIIRTPITTGLATWTTREGAVLRGMLEIIERDAYMITWLNQLSLPRLDMEALGQTRSSLAELNRRLTRYGMRAHAVRLPTDSPTYAVCGSVEDTSGHNPSFTIGLKANQDLAKAVEGAVLEAVRIRQAARFRLSTNGSWDTSRSFKTINHIERLEYWANPEKVGKISFLSGTDNTSSLPNEAWESESDNKHLERLLNWAKTRNYQVASISLGRSKKNVSPWQVEMVVMPELQPMHQNEKLPYLSGPRLSEIPRLYNMIPRTTPFFNEPHPFA